MQGDTKRISRFLTPSHINNTINFGAPRSRDAPRDSFVGKPGHSSIPVNKIHAMDEKRPATHLLLALHDAHATTRRTTAPLTHNHSYCIPPLDVHYCSHRPLMVHESATTGPTPLHAVCAHKNCEPPFIHTPTPKACGFLHMGLNTALKKLRPSMEPERACG